MSAPCPPGPVLRTARLELRPLEACDLQGIVDLVAAPETRRYLGTARPDADEQFARLLRNAGSWHLYGYGSFAARLAGQERIVILCGVFHSWRGFGKGMDDVAEAGWIVHTDHAGQGLAREAMEAILDWFDVEVGPRRLACMIEAGNVASEKLAARLGFVEYGRHRAAEDGPELVLYERLP